MKWTVSVLEVEPGDCFRSNAEGWCLVESLTVEDNGVMLNTNKGEYWYPLETEWNQLDFQKGGGVANAYKRSYPWECIDILHLLWGVAILSFIILTITVCQ